MSIHRTGEERHFAQLYPAGESDDPSSPDGCRHTKLVRKWESCHVRIPITGLEPLGSLQDVKLPPKTWMVNTCFIPNYITGRYLIRYSHTANNRWYRSTANRSSWQHGSAIFQAPRGRQIFPQVKVAQRPHLHSASILGPQNGCQLSSLAVQGITDLYEWFTIFLKFDYTMKPLQYKIYKYKEMMGYAKTLAWSEFQHHVKNPDPYILYTYYNI